MCCNTQTYYDCSFFSRRLTANSAFSHMNSAFLHHPLFSSKLGLQICQFLAILLMRWPIHLLTFSGAITNLTTPSTAKHVTFCSHPIWERAPQVHTLPIFVIDLTFSYFSSKHLHGMRFRKKLTRVCWSVNCSSTICCHFMVGWVFS